LQTADTAIETPTALEFAVDQKISKSLDLSTPAAVLVQADEVID
jgi:hypothetical protein